MTTVRTMIMCPYLIFSSKNVKYLILILIFVPTQSKDKEPMHQFTAHTVTHSSTTVDQTSDSNPAVSDSPTETDTESSAWVLYPWIG